MAAVTPFWMVQTAGTTTSVGIQCSDRFDTRRDARANAETLAEALSCGFVVMEVVDFVPSPKQWRSAAEVAAVVAREYGAVSFEGDLIVSSSIASARLDAAQVAEMVADDPEAAMELLRQIAGSCDPSSIASEINPAELSEVGGTVSWLLELLSAMHDQHVAPKEEEDRKTTPATWPKAQGVVTPPNGAAP
ncbi:hypothetical protein AADZ90_021245 [Aestuariibius sp. 2305UL40-4]|uniref:hypothetical protein n=1 Tax=Aestuariibius violaceus TaxID=3234132 RepID=UPI00345F09FB